MASGCGNSSHTLPYQFRPRELVGQGGWFAGEVTLCSTDELVQPVYLNLQVCNLQLQSPSSLLQRQLNVQTVAKLCVKSNVIAAELEVITVA